MAPGSLRAKLTAGRGASPIVLYCGRVAPEKRLELLPAVASGALVGAPLGGAAWAALEAAVAAACDEAWEAARSSGGAGAYAAPPAGTWEEACTEAMIECLGGTARLGMARAVAGAPAVARAAPAGVVVGWELWPLPGGLGEKGSA